MTTIAWLLLLSGIVILRQVSKGRVQNLGEDLSDAFLAITRGDTKGLTDVFAREGENDEPMFADLGDALAQGVMGTAGATVATGADISKAIGGQIKGLEAKGNKSLVIAAAILGSKAKGYRFGATGPDYYDCSGLMFRAAQMIGYKGGRFTTFTIGTNKAFREVQAPNVQGPGTNGSAGAGIDDIVCWPTHHMGVVSGPDRFYSARSVKSGISEARISTFRNGAKPKYYRFVG
jgi:cell wall-associated NlpC family hydrolase